MQTRPALAVSGFLLLAACQSTAPAPPPAPLPAVPAADRIDGDAFGLKGTLSQGGYALGEAPGGATALTLDGTPVPMDAQRRFAIGFGRDAPSAATLTALLAGGSRVTAHLVIAQRGYDVQSIPGLPPTPTSDPEWLKMRAVERTRINAARALHNASDGWLQKWIWPATGPVSGVYGSQRILGGVPQSPHYGVDIAGPPGTPVVAPADGVVVLAGPPQFSLEGNLVIIDHGMDVNSAYLHLSAVDVKPGDQVRQGQRIGAIGSTGRATGPHLHWGVNWRDVRLDPALLAGAKTGAVP